jgi:outer membrane protein TolC
MLRVSTRAADSGWRPSISLTGGFYTAQTERHGPFDTHDQMRLNGVLVGVSVGILPPASRGFTMDATLYNYAALAGRDEIALGLRAGWKW